MRIHYNELGACWVCDHCIEIRHPWYRCLCNNDNFGDVEDTEDCDEYEESDDYE